MASGAVDECRVAADGVAQREREAAARRSVDARIAYTNLGPNDLPDGFYTMQSSDGLVGFSSVTGGALAVNAHTALILPAAIPGDTWQDHLQPGDHDFLILRSRSYQVWWWVKIRIVDYCASCNGGHF